MFVKMFNLAFVLVLVLVQISKEYRFSRKIFAFGRPYYKIIMALGTCKETLLYFDQKIWGKINLNRVLDISYKSDNDRYKVSRVEIILIINNTSSYAYSEEGVGNSDFAATLYLPTNLNFVIYSLNIYSCQQERESVEYIPIGKGIVQTSKRNESSVYMPFLQNDHQQSD